MKARILFVAALLLCPLGAVAQTINLTVDPPAAKIYKIERTGIRTLLGTGLARFKVEKNDPNQLVFEADGFETLTKAFPKGQDYPKDLKITLANRLVKVSALPFDAQILVNGKAVGTQSADVVVPPDVPTTVEVKKPGFRPLTRSYRNAAGADIPPVTDHFELKDRQVLVTARPSDARILVDGTPVGDRGAADVVVPFDKCVTARASLLGYKPEEHQFCNKEQSDQPIPLSESLELRDRQVNLHATPTLAKISVDGQVVASGDFQLTVPQGQCVEVIAAADGYVQQQKQYCNKVNMPDPPPEEHLALPLDEAYSSAVQSDQANVNFTIEVNSNKTESQAWSTISQVILSKFDVLEITDKATGYLRTAWQVAYYPNSTVRTRVIIKLGSDQPLKYVAKIATEHANGHQDVKNDQAFKEWNWINNSYKDIINELQARLR